MTARMTEAFCCELLSFLYLWTIKSIRIGASSEVQQVVNCFHFCIFELSKASRHAKTSRRTKLWIAFIFVSLNYQKHPNGTWKSTFPGCELLSFLYLWTIKSIPVSELAVPALVVNCFHFCIFELSKASDTFSYGTETMLWIAFIFVSLNYQKHLPLNKTPRHRSCELLSFLYLWTIKSIHRHRRT